MPINVIWVEIESKHLNGIARFWTILSILTQSFVYFLIILMYFYISLLEFSNEDKLTTLIYYNKQGPDFYSMIFTSFNPSYKDRCNEAITECGSEHYNK